MQRHLKIRYFWLLPIHFYSKYCVSVRLPEKVRWTSYKASLSSKTWKISELGLIGDEQHDFLGFEPKLIIGSTKRRIRPYIMQLDIHTQRLLFFLSLFPSIIIKLYNKCYHYFHQSYQSHQNVPDGTGVGEAGCRGGPCWNLSSSTLSWTVLGYNYLKLVGGPYWKRWNDTSPLRLQVPMFHCQE